MRTIFVFASKNNGSGSIRLFSIPESLALFACRAWRNAARVFDQDLTFRVPATAAPRSLSRFQEWSPSYRNNHRDGAISSPASSDGAGRSNVMRPPSKERRTANIIPYQEHQSKICGLPGGELRSRTLRLLPGYRNWFGWVSDLVNEFREGSERCHLST